MKPPTDLMCYARFKLAISTASVAAAKIDGVVGADFATLIDTTCELANGFVYDWQGIWSTSDEKTILEQYEKGLRVCREMQQSMKSLSEIYEQRRTYYTQVEIEKQARRAKRAIESASPDTAGTSDSESQPGPSNALFPSSSDNQARPGATVEIREVKEEPLDDILFNGEDGNTSMQLQTYDEEEFDETKPPLMESQPPAVPKDEEIGDEEPIVDLFCPTTGDTRSMDEEEEIEWSNEKVLHYPLEQYGHYEMRLEPTIRNQVFNPSNVIEIPYHVTPKRCYLCDEQVYYYLVAPFDKARRAAFLESMILTKTRNEESKMMHLKMTDTRAHFCCEHIASGKDLPQNLPSHAKKRRTQEFMKKIQSIKKAKVANNIADETPSFSTSPPSQRDANPGNGPQPNKRFSVISVGLDASADGPSRSQASSNASNGEPSTSNAPQTSTIARRYARTCDICKQLSYPFRFSPSDKAIARKFFADLINITENQRICIRQYLMSNTRAVVCSRHIEPNSKWTTGVAPGIQSATRYTIRAPEPPGSGQNAPLPVKVVVRPPVEQQRQSSVTGGSSSVL